MEAVWLGLIVAISTVVQLWISGRQRRSEKREDYARQDVVAERLLDANERVAANTQTIGGKLDVIHSLVNSNMTTAMQAELDATKRELAMMGEVIDLKRTAGAEPSAAAVAALDQTRLRVSELEAVLRDRHEAQSVADAQVGRG